MGERGVRAGRARRWLVVLLLAVALVATPLVVRAWPAADRDTAAADLLARVQDSADVAWSGAVRTDGALRLPDAGELDDLASLLGERTRLRAWWADADHWRVDRLLTAGEQGVRLDGGRLASWDYERGRATISRDPATRLPRTTDLLPPVLGRRFVRGATASETSRLPAVRVAGRSALGLRIEPRSPLTSIRRVDLWVDEPTGLPLRVEVWGPDAEVPAVASAFTDLDLDAPSPDDVDPRLGERVEVDFDQVLDLADAADQYAPLRPPAEVLGLARTDASDRAVGVYGTGTTQLVAIPLRDREADPLREQLAGTPGAEVRPPTLETPETAATAVTVATVGPLGVLVTGEPGESGVWLLAGSLTRDALTRAAGEVVVGTTYEGDG